MASVVGLLEEREPAARERVEVLRAEADRVLAALAEAETGWQEWVIARQRVDEVMSVAPMAPQAADLTKATADLGEEEPARVARGRGRAVPVRRLGVDLQTLPEGYREIVRVLSGRGGSDDVVMDCRQITVALGLEPVKAVVEGRVRHRAKRLVARGWPAESVPGRFTLAGGRGAGS
ncbi:hypothetical protein [Streptomyces sp. NPDC058572]|uniref:hypothetical protein n=1 Tax=Streptomyces sp. NPDC058572 TaxID=3346546 RepID=UPI0036553225